MGETARSEKYEFYSQFADYIASETSWLQWALSFLFGIQLFPKEELSLAAQIVEDIQDYRHSYSQLLSALTEKYTNMYGPDHQDHSLEESGKQPVLHHEIGVGSKEQLSTVLTRGEAVRENNRNGLASVFYRVLRSSLRKETDVSGDCSETLKKPNRALGTTVK